MTVAELIAVLKIYPRDAPVVALWDSGWANIEKHSLQKDEKGRDVTVFDVEDYGTYLEQDR